jgi:hypothetical protein
MAGFPSIGTPGAPSLPAQFTTAVTMTAVTGLVTRAPHGGTGVQTEIESSRHPAPGNNARAEWPFKEAQMSESPILPGGPLNPPVAAQFAAPPAVRAADSLPIFNWTPAPQTAEAPPPAMPVLGLAPAPPPVAAPEPRAVPPAVRQAGAPEQPGFVPLRFHCQRSGAAASKRLEWNGAGLLLELPRLDLPPLFDSLEEKPAPLPVTARRTPEVTRITGARKAFRKFAESRQTHALAAAAAGLFLAALLWFGPRTTPIATLMAPTNQITAETDVPGGAGAQEIPGGPAPASDPNKRKQTGWVRRVIKERAAVQLSDNFRNGMQAWDTRPGAQTGWAHHPSGYVQTGHLALYRPSASFADYQLEFFGQIESRSMGWVMRAHDTNNYYAMKVSVIDPGLRTTIGIERYPVIGGQKGHRVASPLNVMVHRGKPVLVSVAVKGNHFTASIDGQEVDSWTDQAPSTGGVGFFSEAGERARLYWMRVSKNQDLLGRLCAYLASGSGTSMAGLLAPEMPVSPAPAGGKPLPQPPAMVAVLRGPGVRPTLPESRRALLAAARPQIILLSRRIEPCRC